MMLQPPPPPLPLLLLLLLLAAPVPPSSGAPGGAQRGRGRFPLGQMRCTWAARDAEDAVQLTVKCGGGGGGDAELRCVYEAHPGMCPGFRSDPRGFWKQVGRAVKRLRGKLCTDAGAPVKAGMCKRAPRDAHFKLRVPVPVPAATPTTGDPGFRALPPGPSSSSSSAAVGPTACTRRAHHRKTAEEYCSSSWASVCTFFLSVLQSDDC